MKYYPMFDLFDDFFTGNTTSDVHEDRYFGKRMETMK